MKEINEKRATRLAVKQKLASEGKEWKSLTILERRAALKNFRAPLPKQDRLKAIRLLAKAEAKKSNLEWADLSKEQRQAFVKRLRSEDNSKA